MTPLCIYHANCPDGFTAAWVVSRYYRDTFGEEVELHPGVYGTEPPDVTDRIVFLVDFTYPREHMNTIARHAKSLVVLDHHQTAQANCADLDDSFPNIVLDMDRSGAHITWDFLHPGVDPPDIVRYVEDRDLWRFKLPGTPLYFAALTSHPYTLDAWDEISATPTNVMVDQGVAIERYRQRLIETCVANAGTATVCGVEMPVTNAPYAIASDVAGELARNHPGKVAAYYVDVLATGQRHWGLRSTDDGPDVAEMGETAGGGGHKHAAGFRVPL